MNESCYDSYGIAGEKNADVATMIRRLDLPRGPIPRGMDHQGREDEEWWYAMITLLKPYGRLSPASMYPRYHIISFDSVDTFLLSMHDIKDPFAQFMYASRRTTIGVIRELLYSMVPPTKSLFDWSRDSALVARARR